jgi:glycosyltransferase involved in cell wall biosynthesis
MNNTPKVSVACITYNHEPFIRQCLEGIVIQQTNFPFEVIIGEDCSTDKTRAIIEEFEEKYPSIIKPIFQPFNVGAIRNGWEFVMPNCNGNYIACCEGDDYWTDPLKLQKQVDFLEQNKNYAGCCHNVKLVNSENDFSNHNTVHARTKLVLRQMIEHMPGGMIASCSLVFRKGALGDTSWIKEMHFGDFPLWINLYKSGPIFGMADYMGVYRKHSGGFTYGFNWEGYQVGYPKFYKAAREHVEKEYVPLLNRKTFEVYYHSGSQFVARGEWNKAFLSFKKMLPFAAVTGMHVKALSILGSKLFFYPVYNALKFFKLRR